MKIKTDVAIIGGGVNGCALAYSLAKRGIDAVVLEKSFLGSGASGRCGGGIRQQFSTEENILLTMRSVKIFENLEQELGYETEYKQGGYLILAHTEGEIKQFKENVKLQKRLGLVVRFLEADGINDIVPVLDVDGIGAIGATWCPTDGHADPFKVTVGYALTAKRLGAKVCTYTEVKGMKIKKTARIFTSRGEVTARTIVNAAGARSADIARMVGVDLPNRPYRHEILATEVLKPVLKPMVISFYDNVYFRQTERGEIVGGWGDPNEPSGFDIGSSIHFLKRMAKLVTTYVPAFKHVNVVRQWAGLYDVTPDALPILGRTDGVESLIQVNGFSGHGFMIAPMVAQLMTELIVDGKTSMPIDSMNLRRFKEKEISREVSVVG